MNNEEKILEILQQLQQGQSAMQGDIEGLKQGQAATNARLDGLEQGQADMQGKIDSMQSDIGSLKSDVSSLQDGLQQVRTSQLKVELEQYPRINAAIDGVLGNIQKDEELNARVSYLEKKTDIHDTRLYSLESKISKAL